MNIPVLRWGKPYESLEKDEVVHFITGEPVARVSQAGGGLLERDMRHAPTARKLLREMPCEELIQRIKRAGDLYLNDTLPLGDGTQSPDEFARAQSATTGLPEHMCKANMAKNFFVLSHMDQMLEALTRGLPLDVLTRGFGVESRGVVVSYQAQTPALGLVLPSNSPGVHTLWMPVIPMQIGLVLKPGPQEPWTPYRMAAAMVEAGIPSGAISIYPGGGDVGAAVLASCSRSLIFGGTATVDRYRGNPAVQAHGPGFSKILLGDDAADHWRDYLDLMVESVYVNSGRGCINCSSIWAPRHTREIAAAIAERIGPIEPRPPEDPQAGLAAFTVPGAAASIWKMIETDLREGGVEHATEPFGPRLVEMPRCGYLRPVVVHAESPAAAIVKKEYMFPFATVVRCPQEQMLDAIGPTLVCSLISDDAALQQSLTDATHVDRLNLGPIPTTKLDWLQPHEGNIVDFLFRARALQIPPERRAKLNRQ
ncbi:MAG TPA: aldehyde dehydrogenase family protein [Pirellulales bacterium]|nr:aldehyde dehydrogenase family protein [Pirellulales bacterium]